MDMIIHSYGYGETLVNSLNAIAMIRKSPLYAGMIQVVALGVGSMYAYMMAAADVDGQWKMYLRKVLGMTFLIGALLLPKTSMNVKDHVEKQFWRVDNIPLAFALPIGMIEQVGHLFTVGFEQAFNVVGGKSSFDYYNYGTIFGARLTKDLMRAKVTNPEFVYSLNSFVDRCVITRAKIGIPFTLPELFASEDIWGLVSKNPGIVTRFDLKENGHHTLPNCKEGVAYFERAMTAEGQDIIALLSNKYRAAGGDGGYSHVANTSRLSRISSSQKLNQQINALYQGSGMTVDKIVKHNLMMNAITEYRAGYLPNVKAQMQYESGGLLSADFSEWLLTKTLVIFKNIVYGAFIFLVPLILMSGGMTKYRNWMTMAFSLQLWPALFAMINMIIDYSYDPVKVISYSAWSTEMKALDGMASVAGLLSALIPFLALWITRMGEGGLMHMAGTIMATANSSIASASIEKATGNVSQDNVSIGNTSRNNVSANKYDDNMQYATGRNSIQQEDGSMLVTNPNGSKISMRGAGYDASVGESRYLESEGRLSALQTSLRNEENELASESGLYSEGRSSSVAKEASMLSTISQNLKSDKGYSIDKSTEMGKEISDSINTIDKMTQENGHSWEQNAETHLKTDISLGGILGKYIAGVDAGGGASVSAGNKSSQSSAHSNDVIEDSHASEKASLTDRIAKNQSTLESLGIDKNTQESFRETYEDTKRLEKSMSVHKDRIKAYNQNIDYTRTHGNEFSRDMTQEVIEAYNEKYFGGDANRFSDSSKAVSKGSKEALDIFHDLSQQRLSGTLDQISKGREAINDPNKIDDFMEQNMGNINSNPGNAVKEQARDMGIPDEATATNLIKGETTNIRKKLNSAEGDFNSNYDYAQESADLLQSERSSDLQRYDESSFYNNKAGRLLGIGNTKAMPEFTPMIREASTGKLLRDIEDK